MLRIPSTLLRSSIRRTTTVGGSGYGRATSSIINSSNVNTFSSPNNINNNVSCSIQQQQRRQLHLTPRESDHLLLHNAGRLAQYRLARGLKLNVPETRALIAMQMMELIRNGSSPTVSDTTGTSNEREGTVSSLMSLGTSLLGMNQVLPGVASMVREVQIEATFTDGTKLLTIHDPISKENGDLNLALEGSFLPVPDVAIFTAGEGSVVGEEEMKPGQVMVSNTLPAIEINSSSGGDGEVPHLVELSVVNTGDRPIQVGSHYRKYP